MLNMVVLAELARQVVYPGLLASLGAFLLLQLLLSEGQSLSRCVCIEVGS